MSPFFSSTRSKSEPQRTARAIGAGENIYRAGTEGLAWRLNSGVIRLDNVGSNRETSFASLAVPGDILGCETMLFGCYTFSATALTQCALSPWPEGAGAMSGESMLASLAVAQQRAAEVVALRGGQAADRVLGLIRLFADNAGQVVLPSRQDIADITDLRFETISRIIKALERTKVLLPIKVEGVHATRSFRVDLALAA
ncbi:MAG: Crp/Fnr family transcriptional regulator [Proteobacteria bacterium]|nr:Crp/Fnr family transcriptional regulator [Pseudomonadota bacterium]